MTHSPFSFLFSLFSQKSISTKELAEFIDDQKLGLNGAEAQFEQLRKINAFNIGHQNARLNAGQVGAIVLDLARGAGNAPLADKILERLELNKNWKDQKIKLKDLKTAIDEAHKAVAFGQTRADASAFQNLALELGLNDNGAIASQGELTHQKAAEILADRIAKKEGEPRIAALLKRHVFDDAFIRQRSLEDWKIKEIKANIETAKNDVAKEHARSSSSYLLSKKVQLCGSEILARDLDQWVKDGQRWEDRLQAAARIRECARGKSLRLDLSGLQLNSLPKVVGALTPLRELDIRDNWLQNLPESIGSLSQLKELNARYNKLESLPESITSLTHLEKLDVSINKFQSLPESIGSLIQLEKLDVSENTLKSLPASIGSLTQLKQLDVSQNTLKRLPASIESLNRLEKLGVSNNQLESLPEWIGTLSNLKELNVSTNFLTGLPESIRRLIRLEKLEISSNLFQSQLEQVKESLGLGSRLKNQETLV